MVFNFDNSKKMALSKKDKSNKKNWDKKILSLCNKLNKNKNYFTLSSCSGRVVLIIDEDKKKPDLVLFRSHEKISLKKLKQILSNINSLKNKTKNKTIYFKQEPCILVVACRDKNSQWNLFSKAKNNGWKKSGILSLDKKLLVELMSTENMSFPIIDSGKLLVNDHFLKIIVKKSNSNLERSWHKIKRLENLI